MATKGNLSNLMLRASQVRADINSERGELFVTDKDQHRLDVLEILVGKVMTVIDDAVREIDKSSAPQKFSNKIVVTISDNELLTELSI